MYYISPLISAVDITADVEELHVWLNKWEGKGYRKVWGIANGEKSWLLGRHTNENRQTGYR